jgi:hypothetical protein
MECTSNSQSVILLNENLSVNSILMAVTRDLMTKEQKIQATKQRFLTYLKRKKKMNADKQALEIIKKIDERKKEMGILDTTLFR